MSQSCFSLKTTSTPPSFDSDNPPDYSIMPTPGSGVIPGADSMGSQWISSPCNPKARYRYTDDGHVEIEGQGVIRAKTWPSEVDDWRSLIDMSADANNISRALLAAIVAVESGGKPNAKGPTGKLGLTQLDPDVAKQISGVTGDLGEATIMNPSWNLIHGAKLLAALIDTSDKAPLVWALAGFNNANTSCEPNPACESPDKWGLWTDCGYIDHAIAHINTAIDHGYSGPRQIDLGADQDEPEPQEGSSSSIWPYVLFVGAGAAVTAMVMSGKKKR